MFKKLSLILTAQEKKTAFFLTLLMIVYALLEVSGIASIAPFLAVLGDKNAVENHPKLKAIYNFVGVQDTDAFITILGIISFIILIFASAFRAFVVFAKSHYCNMRKHTLGVSLLKKYIHQPYAFFLGRNSNELTKSIFVEVDQVISATITPLLDLASYAFVITAIIGLLLFVNPGVALSIGCGFGIFYLIFYIKIRVKMTDIGKIIRAENTVSFQKTSEVLNGIKELKILGKEKGFIDQIEPSSLKRAKFSVQAQLMSEIPRYAVEILGFSTVFGFVFYMIASGQNISIILPTLGVYVFAGYRLLPAMQNVYNSLTKLRYGKAAIDAIYDDLTSKEEVIISDNRKLDLLNNLSVSNLSYYYPESESRTLDNISFSIPAKSSMGIIGTTGAGKSTLVDLLLGLLSPSEGEIIVDNLPLSKKNIRSWQNNIGYVPQQIFLSDDNILSNIAFGVPLDKINKEAVVQAARLAQISDFIEKELPSQYDTMIGERGIRLSGGQRQRIGIARALYYNPDILVFDEATSALDMETENQLMKAVNSLAGNKTIIMIAHRLQTIEACDFILSLEKGKLKSFEQKKI